MATKLDKVIKRELEIDGQTYTVTIAPDGVKMTQKGFRKGRELAWRTLWEQGREEGGAARGSSSGTGGAGGALGGETSTGLGGQSASRAEH